MCGGATVVIPVFFKPTPPKHTNRSVLGDDVPRRSLEQRRASTCGMTPVAPGVGVLKGIAAKTEAMDGWAWWNRPALAQP
jgi:hypothetical protein